MDASLVAVVGRDKLIKYADTGKFLGFKKIFKFCGKKTKPREYKRIWVMEEYRLLMSKWNSKQDHVIRKIRLLFQGEISFLMAKHLSHSTYIPEIQSLPAYGVSLDYPYYLQTIIDSDGYNWPTYVTNNDVYCLHLQEQNFLDCGLCIFAKRTEASGYTDGCDSGCWRIMDPDIRIGSMNAGFMGFKRVFRFHENGEDVKGTWIMEEYRLDEEFMQEIVVCVIKLRR